MTHLGKAIRMLHTATHHTRVLQKSVWTPRYFPQFLATTMLMSGVAGYCAMDAWRDWEEQEKLDQHMRLSPLSTNDYEDEDNTVAVSLAMPLRRRFTVTTRSIGSRHQLDPFQKRLWASTE